MFTACYCIFTAFLLCQTFYKLGSYRLIYCNIISEIGYIIIIIIIKVHLPPWFLLPVGKLLVAVLSWDSQAKGILPLLYPPPLTSVKLVNFK